MCTSLISKLLELSQRLARFRELVREELMSCYSPNSLHAHVLLYPSMKPLAFRLGQNIRNYMQYPHHNTRILLCHTAPLRCVALLSLAEPGPAPPAAAATRVSRGLPPARHPPDTPASTSNTYTTRDAEMTVHVVIPPHSRSASNQAPSQTPTVPALPTRPGSRRQASSPRQHTPPLTPHPSTSGVGSRYRGSLRHVHNARTGSGSVGARPRWRSASQHT
jgi:hypothetical protein